MSRLAPELRPLMRAVASMMREDGYARNYRRAIIEGLDTSPEARMARAREQGYEPGFYHSSLDDLEAFQPMGQFYGRFDAGISVADDMQPANIYLDRFGDVRYDGKPFQKNVMPLMVRKGRQKWTTAEDTHPWFGFPIREGYTPKFVDEGFDSLNVLDRVGHSGGGIRHYGRGAEDGIPYTETILNDPSRVRSRFAMFNPRRRDKKDLLAALALALAGVGAGARSAEPRTT